MENQSRDPDLSRTCNSYTADEILFSRRVLFFLFVCLVFFLDPFYPVQAPEKLCRFLENKNT